MTPDELRTRFHELHQADEIFVMPNPWDVGSARMLESLGFPALATTSSGFAWSRGRTDGAMTLDELVDHVAALTAEISVPLNVDSERCFAEDLAGVAETVGRLADAGAAGCSIEDWDPTAGVIDPFDKAVSRVGAAVAAANESGMVLTARAENQLRGVDDLDDTIRRLVAYREEGAHCLYAPGLTVAADIARVVTEVGAPINVLAMNAGPIVSELAGLGVRRVSTGGALARAAYAAAIAGATEILEIGSSSYVGTVTSADINRHIR